MTNLAEELERQGLKPLHVAKAVGCPASTISRIVKGERQPSIELAMKIAGAFTGIRLSKLRPDVAAAFRKDFARDQRKRA